MRSLRLVLAPYLAVFSIAAHAAKPAWKPVAPEELSETAPQLEREAPAEIVFWNYEVDDRDFPAVRKTTEYFRYKIYTPEKADDLTRISRIDDKEGSGTIEIRARLVLPDGRTQEFGPDAIKERVLAKHASEAGLLGWLAGGGGAERREKFLAVTGVERGAVLEYQIIKIEKSPSLVDDFTAQRPGLPVRQLSYTARVCPNATAFDSRVFVINRQTAQLTEDRKAHTVTVSATNLPSIVREPFVGPATDYALTIVSCYERLEKKVTARSGKVPMPGNIDVKPGPWTVYSTVMNWRERDRGWLTPRARQIATELAATATDPTAKAIAIHNYVQALYQKHRRRTGPRPAERRKPDSLDDVIDVEQKPEVLRPSEEFVWLAIALYQAAGFEAHTVLLPDREFTRFRPDFVSPVFLSNLAVALKIGGEWRFSAPHTVNRHPFGLLPWEQEAQVGLLALERKQEFIPVPATPAERSAITSTGNFKLAADGTLTGECTRVFTGQTAVELRGRLRKELKTRREELARSKFGFDPKAAEITIRKIENLDDSEKPLELACRVSWPDFAVRTKDRLIVRADVFRMDASSPFPATERRHPIHFPYRWQEFDQLTIEWPAGYELESKTGPAANPGEALQHKLEIAVDSAKHRLRVQREFASHVLDLPPEQYPALKTWYDRVAHSDQYEVVLTRRTGAEAGN